MLAALGAERLLAGAVSPKFVIGWVVGAGVVALLGVGGRLHEIGQSIAAGFGRAATCRSSIDANRVA